jgi:hypothetical protein
VEPAELARLLGVSEDEAFQLYAQTQVSGFLDEAAPKPRFRVDELADTGAIPENDDPVSHERTKNRR